MKKLFALMLILAIAGSAYAQTWGAKYRVQFTDKNNSPYSINNPQAFLTQRALDRRTNQGIVVTESDIPVNQTYIDSLINLGAEIFNVSRWFNTATVFLGDTTLVNDIEALTFVSSVTMTRPYFQLRVKQPRNGGGNSYEGEVNPLSQKITQGLSQDQNMRRTMYAYGDGFNQANMIGVDYLHGLGYNGTGMFIAVLDAGFYHVDQLDMFDSLRSSGRLLGYKDFVTPGNDLFQESTHGMSVLSTMAGYVPGLLIGTAPGASYWLLRSEDAGSEYVVEEDNWIAAAEYADSVGVDVINSSLGYTDYDDDSPNYTYSDMDGNTARVTRGADMAASKGILVVNSAGNSGNSYWRYIGAPADADSILTIGAVNSMGIIASFSSLGPTADGRVKPTVCAQGEGTYVVSSADGVYPGNGTSFSSPVMAGAVTCLWQANPTFNNMEVIEAVKRSASRYANPDSMYGFGIPNMAVAHMVLSGQEMPASENENFLLANPNPFSEEIDMILFATQSGTAVIQVLDSNGKKVWQNKDFNYIPGYNYYLISGLNSLSNGIYILSVSCDSFKLTHKLLKQ
ncbi:MAG: S8 family serine peptidase [Bacteroidales bacterium]|nr:S8 family serine peptidase [Bacteroidales bacterium]